MKEKKKKEKKSKKGKKYIYFSFIFTFILMIFHATLKKYIHRISAILSICQIRAQILRMKRCLGELALPSHSSGQSLSLTWNSNVRHIPSLSTALSTQLLWCSVQHHSDHNLSNSTTFPCLSRHPSTKKKKSSNKNSHEEEKCIHPKCLFITHCAGINQYETKTKCWCN